MTLPTAIKEPSNNLQDYSILIAGPKKVGKTSFVTQFPNHYMMECEPMNALNVAANYDDIYSWEEILGKTKDLEGVGTKYCKQLIIDSIPSAYYYCLESTRKKLGIDVIAKDNFDVWRTIGKEFQDWILRIRKLGMGITYTCHIEIKELQNPVTNQTLYRMQPAMSNQLYKIMQAVGVLWGIMFSRADGMRSLLIEGDRTKVDVGNGFTNHFLWDNKRLTEIPLGYSPVEAYTNFMLAFNNALEPKQSALNGGKVELVVPKKLGA
jgi:hypothetical protein